jgi:hypothetical protein
MQVCCFHTRRVQPSLRLSAVTSPSGESPPLTEGSASSLRVLEPDCSPFLIRYVCILKASWVCRGAATDVLYIIPRPAHPGLAHYLVHTRRLHIELLLVYILPGAGFKASIPRSPASRLELHRAHSSVAYSPTTQRPAAYICISKCPHFT